MDYRTSYCTLPWNHAPHTTMNKVNIIEPTKTVSINADDTERKNLAIKRFTNEEGKVSMSAACENAANSYASSQCKENNISDFFDSALVHVMVAPQEGNYTGPVSCSWWRIGNRFKISQKIIPYYRYNDLMHLNTHSQNQLLKQRDMMIMNFTHHRTANMIQVIQFQSTDQLVKEMDITIV